MPPLSASDIAAALYGLLRLARLDPKGFDYFEATATGLLKSFWVAAFLLPVFLLYLVLDVLMLDLGGPGAALRYVSIETIAYVVDWVAFPLVMVTLAPAMGLDRTLFRFLVPLNWIQLPVGLILMVPALIGRLVDMPEDFAALVGLTIITASLLIVAALARFGLEVPWWSAAGATVMNFTISLIITGVAFSMAGVGA
ncbi:hypothetical protein [Roseospira navarrensis]|uniref:Uncharacterized protein n=1 Tax=Roseospira navarrensis TaxID=140058 RepID=A0A7X1ZEM7_9PROT|nr:hypothetical protein [Roseospira navarrensis]MQX37168.1 hypothetical protein [Roseospira navarrensis]